MNPIKRVENAIGMFTITVSAAIGATVLAVAIHIKDQIKLLSESGDLTLNPQQVFAISIVVITFIVPVTNECLSRIIKWVFSHSRTLRQKLLRDRYVEGTWIELTKSRGVLKSIAVVTIEYVDYEIAISGKDFCINGTTTNHTFRSTMVNIDYPVLDFRYEQTRHGKQSGSGITRLQFTYEAGKIPRIYDGCYANQDEADEVSFTGYLYTEKENLPMSDPNRLKDFLLNWIRTHAKATSSSAPSRNWTELLPVVKKNRTNSLL